MALTDEPPSPPGIDIGDGAPTGQVANSLEQLQAWVADKFTSVDKAAQELENRVAEKLTHLDDSLGKLEGKLKKVDQSGDKAKQEFENKVKEHESKMKQLTADTEAALLKIDSHFTKLGDLEKQFKDHLEVNFRVLEQ